MQDINIQPNYSTPTTTADSAADGRLKVDVGGMKRKITKKLLNKKYGKKRRK